MEQRSESLEFTSDAVPSALEEVDSSAVKTPIRNALDALRAKMAGRMDLLGVDWQRHLSMRVFDLDDAWAK